MSFASYETYDQVQSYWYDSLPADWRLASLRWLAKIYAGGTPDKSRTEFWENGSIPWINSGAVNQGLVTEHSALITVDAFASSSARWIPSGALVIALAGQGKTKGMVAQLGIRTTCNQSMAAIVPSDDLMPRFLYWLMQSHYLKIRNMAGGDLRDGLNLDMIGSISIPIPQRAEQAHIAQFLDHETAKIDALIAEQQRLIELLKEKRQTLISHAVTKGLNPNAPMKDSGVEWLGEVPAHWELLATKRFFRMVVEPAPENNDCELLSVYTEIGVRPRKELEQKGNKASTTDGYWRVKKGDLIVNKLLAWMGAVGYSEYDGVTSPAYDILRSTRKLAPKFYHYLFRGKSAQQEFKRWSRGIMEMRLRLYFDELGRILMPFPPLEEQEKIVVFMEEMEAKFDSLSQTASEQVRLLSERRSALIAAAVTGKIDVRGWQPPSSAKTPEYTTQMSA